MVINLYDENGKIKPKWIATGLKAVRGNKGEAEAFLQRTRVEMTDQLQKEKEDRLQKEVSENSAAYYSPVIEPAPRKPWDPRTNSIMPPGIMPDMLFVDYLPKWLGIHKRTRSLEKSTLTSYMDILTVVIRYFKEVNPNLAFNEVTPNDIEEFYAFQYGRIYHGKPIKTATVLHYHTVLFKAFKFAFKKDVLEFNPMFKIERPIPEIYIAKFYNRQQLNDLFRNVLDTEYGLQIMMTGFYGLRRSEVCGLRYSAIDFDNMSFVINYTVTVVKDEVTGKRVLNKKDRAKNKSSLRSYPLHPFFAYALSESKKQQDYYRTVCGRSYCIETRIIYLWTNWGG